jgi:hypothetical protein
VLEVFTGDVVLAAEEGPTHAPADAMKKAGFLVAD